MDFKSADELFKHQPQMTVEEAKKKLRSYASTSELYLAELCHIKRWIPDKDVSKYIDEIDENTQRVHEVYTMFSTIYKTCINKLEPYKEVEYKLDEDIIYDWSGRKKILMEVLDLFKALNYNCKIRNVIAYIEEIEDEVSEWKLCISVTTTRTRKICLNIDI